MFVGRYVCNHDLKSLNILDTNLMLAQILNRNEQFSCKIAKDHKKKDFELHQY